MKTGNGFFLALTVFLLMAGTAFAQVGEKPDLVLTIAAQKEVVVKGEDGKAKVEWRDVRGTGPGDVLKYTITYRNDGKAEAREGNITDPVPSNTIYIPGSAEGKDTEISFSVDGKSFQSPPWLTYKVRQADGTETENLATPDMYTHIRWKIQKPVPPGGTGNVSFKVKVK